MWITNVSLNMDLTTVKMNAYIRHLNISCWHIFCYEMSISNKLICRFSLCRSIVFLLWKRFLLKERFLLKKCSVQPLSHLSIMLKYEKWKPVSTKQLSKNKLILITNLDIFLIYIFLEAGFIDVLIIYPKLYFESSTL